MKIRVDMNINQICKNHGVYIGSPAHKRIADYAITLAEPYVPKDSGALMHGHVSGTDIVYDKPYAKRWYYHPAHFSGAPKRGNYWMERMLAEGGNHKIAEEIARITGGKAK